MTVEECLRDLSKLSADELARWLKDHFDSIGGLACEGGAGDRPRGRPQGQAGGEGRGRAAPGAEATPLGVDRAAEGSFRGNFLNGIAYRACFLHHAKPQCRSVIAPTARRAPVTSPRFLSLLLLPLAVALVAWAAGTVLSALDFPAEHDPCAEEALPLGVEHARRDEALHYQQLRAAPAEAQRITEERKALRERMREEVGEVYRRHGRRWRK
jgi:hypothetical protein